VPELFGRREQHPPAQPPQETPANA
jgi:hypothetical protein